MRAVEYETLQASDYENDPDFMPDEAGEELLRSERFDDDIESDVEQLALQRQKMQTTLTIVMLKSF